MKRQFLLMRMLLLFALIVGSGSNAWADSAGFTLASAASTPLSAGSTKTTTITGSASETWNVEITGTWSSSSMQGDNGNKFWQMGSGNNPITSAIFSTSGISGTITQIVVKCSSKSGSATVNATVGGNDFGTQNRSTSSWKTTGNVTFNGSASGTIIVTLSESSGATYIQSITVTYTPSSDPSINAADIELASSATSGEISYTLNNPVEGAVLSATSSNDWISSITINTTDKKITFKTTANPNLVARVGTITVSYEKGGVKQFEDKNITVTQAKAVVTNKYTLATKITPGKHYILVGVKSGSYYAMGEQKSNNRGSIEISVDEGKTSILSDAGVYEVRINGDVSTGYYTIYDEETSGYLYSASGTSGTNNHMRTEEDLDEDGNGTWEMSVDGSGIASIKAINSSLTRQWMRFNDTNLLFSCYQYSDSQSDIYLYERDDDTNTQSTTVTLASACTDGTKYYGTYSSPFSFVVPSDLTVSEIGINEGKLNVKAYKTGNVVPANTGVMVSSTTSGDHSVTLTTGGASVLGTLNRLYGTGSGLANAAAMSSVISGCNYYRLTMHNDDKIGFWWGAENGEAFAYNTANRAFLAVPKSIPSSTRSGFSLFGDDETTGIETVDVNAESANDAREYYNLNGQRVANPSKGLYIVNGKKVIIK